MKAPVRPSTIDILTDLEQEMSSHRPAVAEALREALAALIRPSRGWLTTGQTAERLGITIPTVKEWVKRGTLIGRQLAGRWWVSEDSVDRVLSMRKTLTELGEEGYPSEEDLYALTKRVRRQMLAEQQARVDR